MFDSGVGGLSVLAELERQLPGQSYLYLADREYAPYGERSLDEVRDRAVAIVEYLIAGGATLVVVACNTASAAALHHLRGRFPDTPFVGMEPAVKPAAESTDSGVVGVLATSATFQGELYESVVDRHASGIEVLEAPAVGLALAIEEGRFDDVSVLIDRYVAPLVASGIDRLVLGCTHYPLVSDLIRARLPAGVVLVDPSAAVARQVGRLVATDTSSTLGVVTFLATGDPAAAAVAIGRARGVDVTVSGVRI